MYNILSLLLGLASLVFAAHSLRVRFCPACCCLSFAGCGGALLFQLLEVRRLVGIHDWSALLDTMDAVALAAGTLLAAALLLNLLALLRGRNRQ